MSDGEHPDLRVSVNNASSGRTGNPIAIRASQRYLPVDVEFRAASGCDRASND